MLLAQTKPDALRRAPIGEPAQVLVVDDEPLVRRWLERVLVDCGYVVDSVVDGAAAVAQLGLRNYDLVLTDVTMPRLDGLGVLVASIARDARVPVILMTGAPRPDLAQRALSLGAAELIVKPMPLDTIVEAVGRWVRLHRVQVLTALIQRLLPAASVDPASDEDLELDALLADLHLAYQPIVRALDHHTVGNEALLRSRHPSFVEPRCLLRAATRMGRRAEIGALVRQRCKQDRLRDDRLLFINSYVDELTDFSHSERGFGPKAPRIVVELHEPTVTLAQRAQVQSLRALGYRVCVNASELRAVGPSSLIPDVIKLDLGLVRGVDANEPRKAACRDLLACCADLAIAVIALGVETATELGALRDAGCELFQGHAFGQPEA